MKSLTATITVTGISHFKVHMKCEICETEETIFDLVGEAVIEPVMSHIVSHERQYEFLEDESTVKKKGEEMEIVAVWSHSIN